MRNPKMLKAKNRPTSEPTLAALFIERMLAASARGEIQSWKFKICQNSFAFASLGSWELTIIIKDSLLLSAAILCWSVLD
jgi:hypothetical protein